MPRYSDEQKQEMVKQFLRGSRIEDVAASFGCSVPTVTAALRANGVPARRGPGSVRKSQRKEHVRVCEHCDQLKSLEDFYAGRMCKACRIKQQTAWRKEYDEQTDVSTDEGLYRYLQGKASYYRKTYNLSVDEAFEFYKRRVCDVCGALPSGRRKINDLDHCHKTGVVRGLLCSHHNRVLGFIDEEPETLDALVAYLERARSMV